MNIPKYSNIVITLLLAGLLLFNFSARASYEKNLEDKQPDIVSPMVGNYLSADYASRNNDPITASRIFLNALKKNPDNPVLLQNSYKLKLISGDVDQAIKLAKRYAKYDSDSVETSILLAVDEINKGNFVKAEEILQNLSAKRKFGVAGVDSIIAPFLQLWTKVGQGKYTEALNFSKNMLGEGRVPSLFLNYQSALINDLAGNVEATREGFGKILRDDIIMPYHFTRAAANFYERIGEPKTAKDLYIKYRKQHPELNHFANAIARLDSENSKVLPNRVVKDASDGAVEVLQEAVRVLYNSNFYNKGVSYLRLILYLRPDSAEAKILLAAYHEEKEQYDQAIKLYKTINKKSDFYLTSRVSMAEDLYLSGKKEKAIKKLESFTEEDGKFNIALLTLADLLRKDSDYKGAAEVYSRIISNIKEPQLKDWPVFFARGICYERAGKWELAEDDLLQALELKPGQPEVLNYLGYSWIDRDYNIHIARKMVEKAVKARPNDAQIIDSMGWALYKINDFDKASLYLERAAELIPYDAVINDHLGDTYWRQGRYNEARFQWNRVLRYNNSEDISIETVKKKLEIGLPELASDNS